jgi:hypothetical protein
MAQAFRGNTTSISQIEVNWTQLLPPNNGNSPVLSYNLVWDAGTGVCCTDIIGEAVPYLGLSYTIT